MNLGISEQPGIPNHLRPSLGYWTSIAVRINYFHSMRGYHECRPGLTFMMTFMGLKNRCTTIDPNWWQSTGGILMETSPRKTAMCRQLPARIFGVILKIGYAGIFATHILQSFSPESTDEDFNSELCRVQHIRQARMLLCKDPGESIISLSTPWIWRSMEIADHDHGLTHGWRDPDMGGHSRKKSTQFNCPRTTSTARRQPRERKKEESHRRVCRWWVWSALEIAGVGDPPIRATEKWHHFCGS